MNVTIEALSAGDWRAFRDVRLAALRDSPEAFWASYDDEAAHGRAQWESFLAAATWLAARRGDDAVGLVGLLRREELTDEPELIALWVRPDVRRSGIAGRLVAGAVQAAAVQDAQAVTLWVLASNTDAARLYARLGFAYTGEQMALPRDPTERELRMRKVVTARNPPRPPVGTRDAGTRA